jgi:lipoate synthase
MDIIGFASILEAKIVFENGKEYLLEHILSSKHRVNNLNAPPINEYEMEVSVLPSDFFDAIHNIDEIKEIQIKELYKNIENVEEITKTYSFSYPKFEFYSYVDTSMKYEKYKIKISNY